MNDLAYMRIALGLAQRGLGLVAPNPAVGCVLVLDGRIVGRGWTQPGGRPHAETEALSQAGDAAQGATAYVTLEPCSHTGRTGPCADALINAGIKRCVIAMEDPDPRVSGNGLQRLRAAGVKVEQGLLADEAAFLNAGFLLRIEKNRPLVTLKLATTADARIATRLGESQWITGVKARQAGHMLRYRNDAVMVGIGTVIADDPELTIRLPGLDVVPKLRVVVDSRLRTALTSKLVTQANQIPTVMMILSDVDAGRHEAFVKAGVALIEITPNDEGRIDLLSALQRLAERGVTRLLVEGGSTLAASLLKSNLVDRISWFRSSALIGDDGLAAVQTLGVDHLARQISMTRLSAMPVGNDSREDFAVTHGAPL